MRALLVPILLLSFIGCETDHKNSCDIPAQAHGFSYSPVGFPDSSNQSTAFFEDMEQFNDTSVISTQIWRDDLEAGTDAGKTPKQAELIQDSALQYCFVPVSTFSWRENGTNYIRIPGYALNNWSNVQARTKFISMLVTFANKYRPPYLLLGHENDFYFQEDPIDYANWLMVYNAAYDAIKEVSESTKIGPSFSYEHMSGQGFLKGWNATYWEALEQHDLSRVDVVGLTVFPFFNFEDPADVPGNYLNSIVTKIGTRPIVITQTGWPARNLGGLNPQWSTTEEDQVTYVNRLTAVTVGKNIPSVNWLYYNSPTQENTENWKTFGSVSLRTMQGNEYQVFNSWLNF
ncbi:MAG: hypothetical protein IT286_02635 [Proteobacteria bacterium]|jgi:hypothetical protein|nr:hypothetical protein [Pseudomonadota bacterium]